MIMPISSARLAEAAASDQPTLVACRTVIGKGAPNKQGSHDVHGAPLGADEVAAAREYLGWTAAPFEIPAEILADWRSLGAKGATARTRMGSALWRQRDKRRICAPHGRRTARRGRGRQRTSPPGWRAIPRSRPARLPKTALNVLAPLVPEMVGGSADLTGSNNTKAKCQAPFTAEDYSGRYVYYGIREFGMAAAMNGMALHGGVIPYGGTFLVFSDYCRNAIRLSALQQTRVDLCADA